ncbi:hypothetical protein DPSP01_010622 [Paraphaeosphaeria sporulosa]|uniref:MARVEL domain-containing protein n=1 Tax=Paraphaeosphaeria sporulosa TaxID=1460663 RepID=A0A177CM06_9PLEO|nr:uncharacterized protein CC84DRAFT_1238805 [Paraphaeosphaeria sporulosa]OAG07839.1 hypothetical protein CC84DRAFT_1238805 [Paraphaeosphaeria sporulosa]
MAALDFLNKSFFSPRFMLPLHLVQLLLISVAMGLSVPRLFMKNQPRTRANTIALGMGGKSLILLMYQLLSEYSRPFQRWHSFKANAIINCLEVVFWGAVAFLVMQANLKRCSGISCYLSWGVVGLAIVLNISMSYTAAIAIRQYREFKARRNGTDAHADRERGSSCSMVALRSTDTKA